MAKRIRKLKLDKANYKELASLKIPCNVKRRKVNSKELYLVDILEREEGRVRVHYIGYESTHDEWKDEAELEVLEEDSEEPEPSEELLEPYSLYKDLGVRIKKALSCNRVGSPQIRLVMPFDILLFNGGLRASGIPTKVV